MRREVLLISKERCLYSSAGGSTMQKMIKKIPPEDCQTTRELSLRYVLKFCWNGCTWQKYSGPISNKWEHSLWQKVAKIDQKHQSDPQIQAILWCGKAEWRLQTWSVLRCFICRWRAGFKINVRRFTVRIEITHVCSHLVDVQEANCSFSQQCRVRNKVVWRRFTTGWSNGCTNLAVSVRNIIQ